MSSPKLFISYSWSNQDYEQLILQIATELVESGIDVILDKWDLKEGHDSFKFMEKMVTDPDVKKVAIFSDRIYAEKADGRNGGVGTETQILSREIYEGQNQDKFVVVVTEKDDEGKAYLPTYYKARIYIDLSQPDRYAENFEKLLRWIYNKPIDVKPKIGNKPSFLDDHKDSSLGTTSAYKRALDSLRNDRSTALGYLSEYFDQFSLNLERFRITDIKDELDELIVKNIEAFTIPKNEYVQLLVAIAQFKPEPVIGERVHRFLESLIHYMSRPIDQNSYHEYQFDNFKFIVHELYLYTLAVFLKYERFELVAPLLLQDYYVAGQTDFGKNEMIGFYNFWQDTRSLHYRNTRLKLQRLSIRADMLKDRANGTGVDFRYLMQADFVAFMRNEIQSKGNYSIWWPETLLYVGSFGSSFEIFARAKSQKYFNKLKLILGIESPTDLNDLLRRYAEDRTMLPRWQFNSFNPRTLLNFESLATLP